jgi:uncharacterized protein (TIGR03083 family)
MFDLEAARKITARELDELIGLAAGLDADQWQLPTRCAGWSVRDLCAHAGMAATQQAEAFRRANKGVLEQPEYPGAPELSPAEVLELLRRGAAELDAALAELDEGAQSGMTPLPFAVIPTPVALQIPVYEYAFHRDDLADAIGAAGGLAADVAPELVTFFGGLAPMLAGRAAPGECPHGYRLVAPTATLTIVPTEGGWTLTDSEPDVPLCMIAGTDDAIALFAMGRVPASDPRLKVTGPAANAAADFKRWIPGP